MEQLKKRTMSTNRFDIADYLDSKEMIAEYMNTLLEQGNEQDMSTAIGT
jgi:DNA-binding phage protein